MACTPTIRFSFDDKNEFEKKEDKKEYPGLAVTYYRIDQMMDDFYVIPDKSDPEYTAVAPGVHFTEELFER